MAKKEKKIKMKGLIKEVMKGAEIFSSPKTGRPTKYSKEIADKICELIATTSDGLVKICEAAEFPSVRTIYYWLENKEHEDFLHNYTRAREEQADLLADEIIQIADDGSKDSINVQTKNGSYKIEDKEWTSRSKLRVEARKWKASKLAPKKYGDKVQTEHSGLVGITQITGMVVK